jgi:hypothetical protein
MKLKKLFKNHSIFLLILALALFARTYKLTDLFIYGHEQDLQNWIVKDILINHHPRLIGQETSITGLFIGPFYYYLLVPFFYLLKMNPLVSYIPITIISISTLISLYFVTFKLYGKVPATIASLIYAVSPFIFFLDRWVVPTQLTLIWIVWFYFVLINYLRANLRVTPILIILIGFIWHIHIAFVPLLLLLPVTVYLSKTDIRNKIKEMKLPRAYARGFFSPLLRRERNPSEAEKQLRIHPRAYALGFLRRGINNKHLVISIAALMVLITPLIAFELRHNFQQVRGLTNMENVVEGEGREVREGYYKVEVIADLVNRTLWSPLLYQFNPSNPIVFKIPVLLLIFFALIYFLFKKSLFTKAESILICIWIIDVGLSHYFSKRLISEYYFNNLIILSLIVFSLLLTHFYRQRSTRPIVVALGIVFILYSLNIMITKRPLVGEFKDKTAVVEFIADDVHENYYPCVGINYIGDIPVRYGYRYLFWYNNVDQVIPSNDVPVYSIVQPATISESEVEFASGDIGVILPANPSVPDSEVCTSSKNQLLPLNGFVK